MAKKAKKDASAKTTEPDSSALILTQLTKHFDGAPLSELVTSYREFPLTARVDLQCALETIFTNRFKAKITGTHRDYGYTALQFSDFLDVRRSPVIAGPLQYDELDLGESRSTRCLKQALWFSHSQSMPFAVLLSMGERHSGVHVGIAVPQGESGLELAHSFFKDLETLVNSSGSYRGKVISLEEGSRYSGMSGTIRVHKLHSVAREDVILPRETLQLLERNVNEFIQYRSQLRELGMSVKKGLLFYGPPGTGKTHTIHYLASQLPDHTTILITASQVGLIDEYFLLARFLQPVLMVIEDADLIARDRDEMGSPCEEALLNRLLNEMDGLREDAEILFVLTTNRPEDLEAALASRPGRIDQAIEFPLPNAECREKLIHLYARGLPVDDDLVKVLVRRTDHASPAFIKELMRRAAQHYLQSGNSGTLQHEQIKLALEDMLFSGGTLNVKLLGGALAEAALS